MAAHADVIFFAYLCCCLPPYTGLQPQMATIIGRGTLHYPHPFQTPTICLHDLPSESLERLYCLDISPSGPCLGPPAGVS
ncbi:hypothetical protein FA13DRAFT_1735842 [Coprinellus micaceus]|uniref:Secreted protein n=1 Tax=Coprinellus micaceus TaxID=71717 RepID=A0A4Y7T230_COPMI|nr:hypothetical protein FA13DRAFT_1735842 [Coprinellus micaceus]